MLIHVLLSMFALILVTIFIVITYLLIISKGQVEPFTDDIGKIIPGSIAEKIKVEINGIEQGMFIRGKDINNPVLLFVHGGPGVPEYFLNETYQTDLENNFTVCWWETRGAGLSYNNNLDTSVITTQQFIKDTITVTEYLNNRFGKDKVYLMGHSYGTIIGIQAAAKRSDLYYAYIGMAQAMGNELGRATSNTLTYEYLIHYYIPSFCERHQWGMKPDRFFRYLIYFPSDIILL